MSPPENPYEKTQMANRAIFSPLLSVSWHPRLQQFRNKHTETTFYLQVPSVPLVETVRPTNPRIKSQVGNPLTKTKSTFRRKCIWPSRNLNQQTTQGDFWSGLEGLSYAVHRRCWHGLLQSSKDRESSPGVEIAVLNLSRTSWPRSDGDGDGGPGHVPRANTERGEREIAAQQRAAVTARGFGGKNRSGRGELVTPIPTSGWVEDVSQLMDAATVQQLITCLTID